MTAEQYITLILGLIASSAVVLGPILLYLVKIRHDNQVDHAAVTAGQESMIAQLVGLQAMIVETAAELRAHTKWEESQKYASMEQIEHLIRAVKDVQDEVREQGEG